MVIDELSNQFWQVTNPGGNYSNNGYPTRVPQLLPPNQTAVSTGLTTVGDGVIDFNAGIGNYCPKHLVLIPYGIATTNTFSMKVLGWRPTKLGVGFPLWVPVTLCTIAVTLGNATGVAGSDLGITQIFNTTLTMTGGPTFITSGAAPVVLDWLEISPTGNPIGMVIVPSFGFNFLEVIYTTGGVATSCNALYCKK